MFTRLTLAALTLIGVVSSGRAAKEGGLAHIVRLDMTDVLTLRLLIVFAP